MREIRIAPALRPTTVDIVRRHLASRQGEPFHRATMRRIAAGSMRSACSAASRSSPRGGRRGRAAGRRQGDAAAPAVRRAVGDRRERRERGPGVQRHQLCSAAARCRRRRLQFGGATTVGARVERPTVTPGAWDLDARSATGRAATSCSTSTRRRPRCRRAPAGTGPAGCRSAAAPSSCGSTPASSDIALSPDGTDHPSGRRAAISPTTRSTP